MYLDLEMKVISMAFYRKVLKTRDEVVRHRMMMYPVQNRKFPNRIKPQLRIVKNDVHS